MATDLTQDQLNYIAVQVTAHAKGKWQFLCAASTDADKKLAVVTTYTNDGELHNAVVKVGDNSNWLNNSEQFTRVVASAMKALS